MNNAELTSDLIGRPVTALPRQGLHLFVGQDGSAIGARKDALVHIVPASTPPLGGGIPVLPPSSLR
ncbi:hypothetical protein ACFONN_10450 [Dyella humi]|uniref:Uncharacterized protein n=1 Tax=Dyella humi TaxID=1770547 RepID=A0ABW8IJN9_9GAMM